MIVAPRVYLVIFLILLVLTAVTAWVSFFDFGALNVVIALTIAVGKALLVVLYFMHVRWLEHLSRVFVAAGFFWFVILVGLTMSDFLTRGD